MERVIGILVIDEGKFLVDVFRKQKQFLLLLALCVVSS